MDIIFIRDLRIDTVIGIFDWERQIKQTVVLDLEMAADCQKAAASDRVEDTLDYKAIGKALIEFVGKSEFQLVETLAEGCAQLLIKDFGIPWLKLSVNKEGALRGARDVGVVIERGTRS